MAEKLAVLWILFFLSLAAWEDWRNHQAANWKVLAAAPALIWFHTCAWLPSTLTALGAFWMWNRGAWGGADAKWAILLAFANHTLGFAALLAAVAAGIVARLSGRTEMPCLPWMLVLSLVALTTIFPTPIIGVSAQG